jgi:hypothetical protein
MHMAAAVSSNVVAQPATPAAPTAEQCSQHVQQQAVSRSGYSASNTYTFTPKCSKYIGYRISNRHQVPMPHKLMQQDVFHWSSDIVVNAQLLRHQQYQEQ